MRSTLAATILLVLAGTALGGGFPDRDWPAALAAAPDEESGWEGPDWGGRPAPPPDEVGPGDRAIASARRESWVAPRIHIGFVLPFLAKETDFAGGFGIGAAFEIGLGGGNGLWLRPGADLGFLAAEEDTWEADSTLLLLHVDGGLDAVRTETVRVSAFLSLGSGFEFFSGAETVGAGKDVSETNVNLLGGLGGALGLRATPALTIELSLRLDFPLGSRNVQGLALAGLAVSYRFQ